MTKKATYRDAGVDIDAGNQAVELMKASVSETHGSAVLAGLGAFGGLFSLSAFNQLEEPVLAASTDGVGTKVRIAAKYARLGGVGQDLVNHCINDIMVQGARPLFFLDYVASSRIEPKQIADIVHGMAHACKASGCALLGGETAEMPGVYADGEVDVVGTIVGIVDRARVIDGQRIEPGDVVLGLPSVSPHTNGYSLIRHILGEADLSQYDDDLGDRPLDALLVPHRSYFAELSHLFETGIDLKGLVHITGGGFIENPPRILNDGLAMHIDRESWVVPRLYTWLQEKGSVSDEEMHRVFNMGIGLLMVVSGDDAKTILGDPRVDATVIGEITKRKQAAVTFSPVFSDE